MAAMSNSTQPDPQSSHPEATPAAKSPSDRGRVTSGVLQEAAGGLPAGEELLSIPEAAERMGVGQSKVLDLVQKKKILDTKIDGVRYLPARFFDEDGQVTRFLPGVVALLLDGGYQPTEILEYLFTEDDSLPGRPVDALHGHLAREVRRRAQAMALI